MTTGMAMGRMYGDDAELGQKRYNKSFKPMPNDNRCEAAVDCFMQAVGGPPQGWSNVTMQAVGGPLQCKRLVDRYNTIGWCTAIMQAVG